MRIVILGSGRGSNAEAILTAQQAGRLGRARVVQILSDKPDAGILGLGARFGVPATYVDPAPFKTKLEGEGESRFIAAVQAAEPDLVVLAGFMRVLKPGFLNAFAGKIINLHPSLLPSFPGLDGIGQARGPSAVGEALLRDRVAEEHEALPSGARSRRRSSRGSRRLRRLLLLVNVRLRSLSSSLAFVLGRHFEASRV